MFRLRRLPALASVLAVACATLAAAAPALGATSAVVSKTFSAAETAAAKAFWTPSRVSAATNATLIPLTGATTLAATPDSGLASPTAVPGPSVGLVPVVLGALFQPGYPYDPYYAPIKSTGRLDFTYPDGTASYCSASAVRSETRNDVLTAAHCLCSVPGSNTKHGAGWHSNVRFTPGYKNGTAPWGTWYVYRTSGMSGGPVWLYGGYGSNPWTGAGGLVNGVQSAYIPGTSPTTVTSAYFGNDVQALCNSVRYI